MRRFVLAALLLTAYCLLPTAIHGQGTPGTVRCPSQADTLDSLFRIKDAARTVLASALSPSSSTITVTSTLAFPSSGSIKVDDEVIYYSSKTDTSFGSLARGAGGTAASAHANSALVTAPILAAHHNTLAEAIVCTEQLARAAVPGSSVDTDPALAANSDGKLSSQKAVRKYVDDGVGVRAQCAGSDDTAGLAAAVTAANGGRIVIVRGQTCAGSDVAIPNLRIEKGGLLKPVSGHTVTLTGNFEAGTYQAFTNALAGQGTISFSGNSSLKEVPPEWWGGSPGASSTTQMAAFQQAVDTGFIVRLSATLRGTPYSLNNSSTPLMLNNPTTITATIIGAGPLVTLVGCTSMARACIQGDYPAPGGSPAVVIKDFFLRGAAGATPGYIPGNFGISFPGHHDGVDHVISNLVIENMQIDQFGDSGIFISGNTGPVRLINNIINDVGNYAILSAPDDVPTDQSQDITIDGGSAQGPGLKGGIAIIGSSGAATGSLTIRDIDIELGTGQTKPGIYLEHVHGALITGVTVASTVPSLLVGDANIYLADGVYGCTFEGVLNKAYEGLHNVHGAGVTHDNIFVGGQFTNKATGPGYAYKAESGSVNNLFISTFIHSSNYQLGHDVVPTLPYLGTANTFSKSQFINSTSTSTAGLVVAGGGSVGTASIHNGEILVGDDGAQLRFAYDAASGVGYIDSLWDNASASLYLRTRAAGSAISVIGIKGTGDVLFQKTVTAGGTTGAQTINKTTGSVNFAAAATSLVVTNSLVTASSIVQCTVATNDATMKSVQCVAGSGSFTIYANAAATAETRVNFTVTN
jgi:hypothetical protein